MNLFDSIFTCIPAKRIAVCREHHHVVTAKSIVSHIRLYHGHIGATEKQAIFQQAQAREQDGKLAADTGDIQHPDEKIIPIEGLPVWSDGKKCITCGYIRRARQDIQKHCREEHGWTNPRARGGKPGAEGAGGLGEAWVDGVHCQRFGHTGTLQRLFEVIPPDPVEPATVQGRDETEKAVIGQYFQTLHREVKQAEKKAAETIHSQSRFSGNTWLKRTRWARHLRGFHRPWLVHMSREPDPEPPSDEESTAEEAEVRASETALATTALAIERVIWRAQRSARVEVVGSAVMEYIERREAGGHSDTKPFHAEQKGQTMEKYSKRWKAIMAYIWRTHALEVYDTTDRGEVEEGEEDGDEKEDGVDDGTIEGRRPGYYFTTKQTAAFARVQQEATAVGMRSPGPGETEGEQGGEEEDDTRQLEDHVLDFFIALLDHDIGDSEFHNALYSGLAVIGVDGGSGWKTPQVYTPILSAVVTVARMLVIYKAKRAREDEIRHRQQASNESAQEARRKATSHFDRVKHMVRRFMTIIAYDGKPSPIDSILRLRSYGMAMASNTNADGVIDWHGDELLHGHIQFRMASLRMMLHGMLHATRRHLRREVLLLEVDDEAQPIEGAIQAPRIHWDRLVDNAAEKKAGWSFVDDPRNEEAFGGIDGGAWLAQRVQREDRLRRRFFEAPTEPGNGRIAWRMSQVHAYGETLKAFRSQLMPLVHMSGGQPARGTEFVTIQYQNGPDGDPRGVLIEDGIVVCVTLYNKTTGLSAQAKVIHRYLPREVGELLVYYIWLVIPFWKMVVRGASRGEADWSTPYIWEPQQGKAWPFPEARGPTKRKGHEGTPTKPRARRVRSHSVVSTRPSIPSSPSLSRCDTVVAEEGEADGGIGEGKGEKGRYQHIWQPEPWGTARVGRAIAQASWTHMGTKLGIMVWRHAVKAIYRRYVKNQAIIDIIERIDQEDEKEGGEGKKQEAESAGFGHGKKIGDAFYGRLVGESMQSTESMRDTFRRISHEWHVFCMFDSALQAEGYQPTTSRMAEMMEEATVEEDRRWRAMRQVDIHAQLATILGPEARFRGVQEEALQAIMQQASPVVVVMGTGGGKSMLFMLPARCSHGVTVVIVPLVSLRNDIKDRCDQMGIECVEWNSGRPHEWASVVLVTPESAVGESFGHFVNRQRAMGRLDRIVVDECHVALDSAAGQWRTRILGLRGLVRAETQLVYLTATLRPADEAQFGQLVGLPEKGVHWFRARTTRKNVQYQVQRFTTPDETEEDVVAALVEAKKQKYGKEGQIIVYCDTVQKTKQYAKRFGGLCYHRNVGSVEEKKSIVRALTEGHHQVFTATNALGLGVDAPTIRVVIHVGIVRRLRDYAQESGRAGRDGQASEAIIVRATRQDRRGKPVQETVQQAASKGVEQEMWELVEGQGCVRAVLDREMDGRVDRRGCEEGEEACYRCGRKEEERRREERWDTAFDVDDEYTDRRGGQEPEGGDRQEPVPEDTIQREIDQGRAQRRKQGGDEARRQAREAWEVDQLQEMAARWAIGCPWCHAVGETETRWQSHELRRCQHAEAEAVRTRVAKVQQGIRWAPYSGCYVCGFPQSICARYEEVGQGIFRPRKGGRCQYERVLFETVICIWAAQLEVGNAYFQVQLRQQGKRWDDTGEVGEVIQWMGGKIRWGGIESNEMCRAMVQIPHPSNPGEAGVREKPGAYARSSEQKVEDGDRAESEEKENDRRTAMERRTQQLITDAQEPRRGEIASLVRFAQQLDDWTNVCIPCRLDKEVGFRHTAQACPEGRSGLYETIQGRIEWVRHRFTGQRGQRPVEVVHGCDHCALPQGLCDRWESEDNIRGGYRARAGTRCQHGQLVFQVFAEFWIRYPGLVQEVLDNIVEEEGGIWNTGNPEERMVWIRRKIQWGPVETNNLCRLFCRIIDRWNHVTGDTTGDSIVGT